MKLKLVLSLLLSVVSLLFAGCYSGESSLIPKRPFVAEEVTEGFNVRVEPKVDILFIIDDSGSMGFAQDKLAQNIQLFTSAMEKNQFLDYQIGVISSSIGERYLERSGKLIGSTPLIKRQTANSISLLPSNISSVGTSGDAYEKIFDPVQAAIDPSLNLNPGFFRSDAFFVLIVITDAEDQSLNFSGFRVHDMLVNLKGYDTDRVLGYGVFAYPKYFADSCSQDETDSDPKAIFNFMSLFSNAYNTQIGGGVTAPAGQNEVPPQFYNLTNVFSLCDPLYGQKLANIGDDIRLRVSQKIPLPVRPIDGTIRLLYGSEEIDQKWWKYDFGTNSIILNPEVELDQSLNGAQLFVVMDQADPTNTIGKPEE